MTAVTSDRPMNGRDRHRRNLFFLRALLYTIVLVTVAFPRRLQPAVDATWGYALSSTIYKSSIWETLLTIGSYAALEAFYTSLAIDPTQPHTRIDKRHGKTHLYRNGTVLIRPYGRRLTELVEYAGPLLFLDLTMVKKFVGVPPAEIIRSGGYDAPRDSITGLAIRPTWKIPTLHNFSWRSPVQLHRALPLAAPTSREISLTIIGALIVYDFFFFLPHIAFHKIGLLWRIHVPHHLHSEIHPQVTNHLSVTERMTLLLAANLALHVLHAHPLTRTIFVPIFLYLLVENHCGLDLPYGYHKLVPGGLVAGPEEHAEHHRHGKVNFQPYLTWADKLCGTHSAGKAHRGGFEGASKSSPASPTNSVQLEEPDQVAKDEEDS